jgi:hypothetical protein
MGPGYFVIAILGCADGSSACTRVATMPVQYATEQSCSAEVRRALEANTDLDFPNLVAECQPIAARPSADRKHERPRAIPASARRS